MTKTNCCVPYCHATSKRHTTLKFYTLPKDAKVRNRWDSSIRNGNLKVNSKGTSVCSLHFCGGRKTYDINHPTIFPWTSEWEAVVEKYNDEVTIQSHDHSYTAKANSPRLLTLDRPKSASKTVRVRHTLNSTHQQEPNVAMNSARKALIPDDSDVQVPILDLGDTDVRDDRDVESITEVRTDNSTPCTKDNMRPYYEDMHVLMQDHLQHLLQQIESWLASDTADITAAKRLMLVLIKLLRGYKEQAETLSVLRDLDCFKLSRFEGSDADIRFWTGFYSYDALKIFWEHYVEPNTNSIRYWGSANAECDAGLKCGPRRKLCPIDELFLVLVKLKRGSANNDLAERFHIHESHVSRLFITWIKLLHIVLSSINIWLPRGKVKEIYASLLQTPIS
ncbi:hypothetical protein LSAT2_010336 [Lamellibrachia satsuma]|nr:hypothetical protein LSAT2_010336 [Lamellibrachia satsuma]